MPFSAFRIESLVGKFMKQQMKGEWTVIATEESINRKRERRQEQIGSEIQRLIHQAFIDKRLGLPLSSMKLLNRPIWDLTGVKMSRCLTQATIGYILHLDAGVAKSDIEAEFYSVKASFKNIISQNMRLKRVPDLKFEYDSNEHAKIFARRLMEDDPLYGTE